MRKIVIAILLSHFDLYVKNFTRMRDHYLRMVQKYNLPIDVIGYIGDPDDPTWYDPETHILHCSTDDDNLNKKRKIFNTIYGKEYDVIIATNASTVVNIRLLNEYIQSEGFRMDYIHGISTEYAYNVDNNFIFNFFQGTFTVYSKEIIEKVEPYWEESLKFIFETDGKLADGTPEEPYKYASDDMVMSYACHLAGVKNHPLFSEYEAVIGAHNNIKWTNSLDDLQSITELAKSTCVLCKTTVYMPTLASLEYHIRSIYEPVIISMVCASYEGIDIDEKTIEEFIKKNSKYLSNYWVGIGCYCTSRK